MNHCGQVSSFTYTFIHIMIVWPVTWLLYSSHQLKNSDRLKPVTQLILTQGAQSKIKKKKTNQIMYSLYGSFFFKFLLYLCSRQMPCVKNTFLMPSIWCSFPFLFRSLDICLLHIATSHFSHDIQEWISLSLWPCELRLHCRYDICITLQRCCHGSHNPF
jgi:hypothetical protein